MKVFAVVIALAAAALAAPTEAGPGAHRCTPATYACAHNPKTGAEGWKVCDTQRIWQYGGDCPPKTKCMFLAANGSPYCIPI